MSQPLMSTRALVFTACARIYATVSSSCNSVVCSVVLCEVSYLVSEIRGLLGNSSDGHLQRPDPRVDLRLLVEVERVTKQTQLLVQE